MTGRPDPPISDGPRSVNRAESYPRILVNLGGVLAALGAIGFGLARMPAKPSVPPVVAVAPPEPTPAPPPAPEPEPPTPAPEPQPVAPAPPKLDREAVARAEGELDAASRDRARAEARAEEAAQRLADATTRAAAASRAAGTLASRVRDPSARIATASAQGGFLKGERDRLARELATLARAPRPQAKVLTTQNPVAKPADGDELHFEVRSNRVSFIDLERLLDLVKADARLRIRLGDGARVIDGQVGPVSAFSMRYSLARSLPLDLEEALQRRSISVSYNLRSWEVVPEFEGRGETYEAIQRPISDFARAISRSSSSRATITLWIYPDSFALYRKIRDDLHARGYLVAARPLPQGMAIRGSPSGSLSAGQ